MCPLASECFITSTQSFSLPNNTSHRLGKVGRGPCGKMTQLAMSKKQTNGDQGDGGRICGGEADRGVEIKFAESGEEQMIGERERFREGSLT